MSLLSVILAGTSSALWANEVAPARAPVTHVASATAPDPAVEITELARRFRAGDLAGLAEGLTPRSRWEAARQAFAIASNKPTTDTERARFAEKIRQFTAPDAVDQLMLTLEPEMTKARPQLAGMTLMALGAMQVAIKSPDTKLTEAQRQALESALPGIQRWASNTDFLSPDSMRRALTVLTDAARRTGITDIDQLKTLPLEGVLERAGPMLVAAKEAVRTYGIDLDAVADSLKVDVLALGKDTARVRTTVTLFGAPVWAEHDLVLVEGHWYGKHVLAEFDHEDAMEG
ncbi:hypothetical protein [Tahibacter sp.]|uniref:hypothetical protein n=1 Tax=Tahibacter sp. TaxID=2056211 RepID=UPI0028C3C28C|nr:hypothetical protein [Tahibacter sp.]